MSSSVNNQNPLTPNAVFSDCSEGLCSIYCPQWCYIIYPPPPPSIFLGDSSDDDSSSFEFSPLIVAIIGILASAFILLTYYTIISRFCRRRDQVSDSASHSDEHGDGLNNELAQVSSSSGLHETLIKSITVCKYKKNDGFVEGTDCSVCLSEFQENENLRLLPNCNHAFHLPCIDTWLRSHSSCPLCRSNISSISISLSNQRQTPLQEPPCPTISVSSALEYQSRNDAVIMVQNLERGLVQEIVVDFETDNLPSKSPIQECDNGDNMEETIQRYKRSISLNSCSRDARLRVADILNANEEDEEFQRQVLEVGSSRGIEGYREENGKSGVVNMVKSPVGMRRSVSTGRFAFTNYGKGKHSVLPN
ncbi:hypothetical protein L6164_000053 [Bauhinia variegata]|uniref:Uncharacterized protein n=1 Tax=Bauhinia variegata TaxID=167791 RepID=A0ACB9Q7C6_BAUVA|nr:hypothetical protein L6164_000053 [Bauhinia variegata]